MTKKTILSFVTCLMLLCASAYAGDSKIVFSKSPIDAATGENLANPASFAIGETVHCRVYLPKAIGKYKDHTGKEACKYWQAYAYIDDDKDNKFMLNEVTFKNGEETTTTNFSFILGEGTDYLESKVTSFKKALNNLKPGNHKITVLIWLDKPRVTGEFILNKSENVKAKFGISFNDVKAKMNDVSLEDKAMKFLKENQLTDNSHKHKTYLKLKIIIPEWEIRNHPSSGVIIGRSIDVAVLFKGKDGNCAIEQYCLFQSYNGKGYQETLQPLPLGQNFNSHKEVKFGPSDCD